MSDFTRLSIGGGIVILSVALGFAIAGPMFDAGARSICSLYAKEHRVVLIDAEGDPFRGGRFHPIPAYSCRFRGPGGSTFVVEERDGLIDPGYPHRGHGLAGFFIWAVVVAAGVGVFRMLSSAGPRWSSPSNGPSSG